MKTKFKIIISVSIISIFMLSIFFAKEVINKKEVNKNVDHQENLPIFKDDEIDNNKSDNSLTDEEEPSTEEKTDSNINLDKTNNDKSNQNNSDPNKSNNNLNKDDSSNKTDNSKNEESKEKEVCDLNNNGYAEWLNNYKKTNKSSREFDNLTEAKSWADNIARQYGYGYFYGTSPVTYNSNDCYKQLYFVELYIPAKSCNNNPLIYLNSNDEIINMYEFLQIKGFSCPEKID